jgi:hypothetical protein
MKEFGLESRRIGTVPEFGLTPRVFDVRYWGARAIPVDDLSARLPPNSYFKCFSGLDSNDVPLRS